MQLEHFLQLIKQDTALQAQIRETSDEKATIKQLLQLGLEKGYSFTEEDLLNFWVKLQAEMKQAMTLFQLSEEDLESVAGGGRTGDNGPRSMHMTSCRVH